MPLGQFCMNNNKNLGHFPHFATILKKMPFSHSKNGGRNTPPKWWTRQLFHVFTTFGWEISKFWILHILASFLECKRGIFFKVVAKPGKCPKNQNFCRNGLYTCWYKVYQEATRFWKLLDFLVHPNYHCEVCSPAQYLQFLRQMTRYIMMPHLFIYLSWDPSLCLFCSSHDFSGMLKNAQFQVNVEAGE